MCIEWEILERCGAMTRTVCLVTLAIVLTSIVVGTRFHSGSVSFVQWVHNPAELRKISENSSHMRGER
jgi:hypothetical protein